MSDRSERLKEAGVATWTLAVVGSHFVLFMSCEALKQAARRAYAKLRNEPEASPVEED